MHEPFRPSDDQRRLFAILAQELRDNEQEYLEAATWFGRVFSLQAIDERKEADLGPDDRDYRESREREGGIFHKRQDPSGYMERLLRATEYLIRVDDSALPKRDRIEHYRRTILVGALMTDPDIHEEVSMLSAALGMERSHWPTAKALIIGDEHEVALDRWWAREEVFDPDFTVYRPFQPLAQRALDAVKQARERASAARPPQDPIPRPVDPCSDAAAPAEEPAGDRVDPATTLGLEIVDAGRPRRTRLIVRYGIDATGRPRTFTSRGRTQAFLAKLVIEQPDQDHKWADLVAAGNKAGHWVITSVASLQRAGQRLHHELPADLKGHWQQGESGVRWVSS